MMIMGASNFCNETKDIWEFVGTILTVFKIVIPVLIIILGSIDLGKAVVASDDKAIKSATNSLIKRFIIGVVIFFVPTLVSAVFNLFAGGEASVDDAAICINCLAGNCAKDDK